MSRKAHRAAIKTILQTAGVTTVYTGAKRTFGGLSPVGLVLSKSELNTWEAHSVIQNTLGFLVRTFVRVDIGDEESAEDKLDDLRDAAGMGLRSAGYTVGESNAAPDGVPLRNIDGVFYRVEDTPVSIEEYA